MSEGIRFETDRLTVAVWDDVIASSEERAALSRDLIGVLTPPVLAHLPPSMQLSHPAEISDWTTARQAESTVLTVRATGADLVGLVILARAPGEMYPDTFHIGYLLAEAAWGHGYATELIAGLVAWFRKQGDAVQLWGGVSRDNGASARVLTKNGFVSDEASATADAEIYGLYIPCDYDKLYRETKNALGQPGAIVVDFFETQTGWPLRVLDVGCGQGRDALFIAERGHHVLGVDLSPNGIADMISGAERLGRAVEGVVADLESYQPTGTFDVLLFDRTLHMLPEATRYESFARLLRHVDVSGWVILIDEPDNMRGFQEALVTSPHDWQILDQAAAHVIAQRTS